MSRLFPAGADAFVARAAGSPGRLPALASELVAAGVRTILAVSALGVRAARGTTC